MDKEYQNNEFYEELNYLANLVNELADYSDLDDELPSLVEDINTSVISLEEKYQLLYNGLPAAISRELEYSDNNTQEAPSEEYRRGYIAGLKAAVIIFKQVRDQY